MYEININGKWTRVDDSAALDRLGDQYATFSDIETAFFSLALDGTRETRFCVFTTYNVRLFAFESMVIKYTYDAPRFRFLIKPSDFLDPQKSYDIEQSLGLTHTPTIGE